MRSTALRVPRSDGERWRRHLRERGLLRGDLGIRCSGEWILLPVRTPDGPAPAGEWLDAEFDPRGPSRPSSYRELLDLPPMLARELPRAFDVVGDIVVIRLPESLRSRAVEIGSALRTFVPGARRVGIDHGVRGPFRLRAIEVVSGEGPLRTVHRENGIDFVVDLDRAYFSPRLAREHDRVARAARPGERVLDLCCGIGPFALTLAVRVPSLKIAAVDLNPDAIDLLRENAGRLSVGDRIEAQCADAAEFLREGPPVNRAVLNLPHTGATLLGPLSARVAPGGSIHYYEVVARVNRATRPIELIGHLRPGGGWTVSEEHVVHEYSPASDLRGYTIRRSGGSDEGCRFS